ncbi:hypothetical protein [Seonamhaeicola marinus]|uniref:HTH luxR-type domain-containing protein n=1 Tax=Seonamhaeicola marinus TaxID=1912246 RepID=A0A5D0HEV1_9FLAO|nr:hypothetical protein [Seonamhaeicola marinus]TYA69845.1 hypothetical protein FUA24_21355 [Seonamhaeicola marinus]
MKQSQLLFGLTLLCTFLIIGQTDSPLIDITNLKGINSDSLIAKHKEVQRVNLIEGDTLSAIKSLIELSSIYSTTGNYPKSYDGYWEALIYSNAISDSTYIAKIYRKLGTLYSIFRREKKAEHFYQLSLKTTRKFLKPSKKQYKNLNDTYYIIASHNRENGNYGLSEKYLDSCKQMHAKLDKTDFPFVEAEQGYIYYHLTRYDDALKKLLPNELFFKEKYPEYLVIFYSFLGDIYFKKEDYSIGESYYLKALEYSKTYQSHSNYVPDLYQKLGDLYFSINKKDLAYENLQRSKELMEALFGVRSQNNSDILEIKDAFRLENEKQKAILETEKLNKLEQQQQTLFFRNVALTVSILSLLLISGIIVWYLHKRRTSEKNDFLSRQKLSKEKNAEILALKNRELTSSALQLIQKDQLIQEIKDSLKSLNKDHNKDVKDILTKIRINKNFDWTQFNARFTSVNKFFYKTLSDKFPELTRKDHRLCALIKLNFSSKEISQLLGISPESVNTSRYRLRKKMRLLKDDDLYETIGKL